MGVDRSAGFAEFGRDFCRHPERRNHEFAGIKVWTQTFRQHCIHLGQNSICRCGHGLIAIGSRHVRAEQQSLQFLFVEHHRRHLVAASHHVTHACLAFDGHTRHGQVGHVAVDGPHRNLQALRNHISGQYPTAAEHQHNLK